MASENRRQAAPLSIKTQLLEKPSSFSFFQAVRLLRFFVGKEIDKPVDTFLTNNLRVRPDLSLAFPGTDLVGLEEETNEDHVRYSITSTFLGLYGASSPLPTFYTEELLNDITEDVTVARDFLDIVNYPLYPLFIRCWTKYRPFIKVIDEHDSDYLERLFCLLGLGVPELRDSTERPFELIRYIGLFSQWPRSAMGLRTLISDALGVEDVEVTPCVERKVKIPKGQHCHLGVANNQLGEDAYLGEEIDDRMGKFRLTIGPMDEKKYHTCLPDSENFEWMRELTKLYLLQPLECDLELVLNPKEAQPPCLGQKKWSALGHDTWIYSSPEPEDARAQFTLQVV